MVLTRPLYAEEVAMVVLAAPAMARGTIQIQPFKEIKVCPTDPIFSDLPARRVDAKAPSSRPLAALAVGLFVGIEVGAIYWVANLL